MGFPQRNAGEISSWATEWDMESTEINGDLSQEPSITVAQLSDGRASSATQNSPIAFSPGEDLSMSMVDPNLDDLDLFLQPSQTHMLEQNHIISSDTAAPMALGLRPRNEIDSQCFLECCHILSDLENIIIDEVKTSKIVLGNIKQALECMTQWVELQQESRNLRCRMLFGVLMYQIAELFETCLATAASDKDRLRNGTRRIGRLSEFRFGDYSMDAEEQLAFRTQTILKEVRRALVLLEKMKGLIVTGAVGMSVPTGLRKYPGEEYHRDLQRRFDDIAERLNRD
ncbi:hypothetical protein ONZ43_g4988 [Nemania bipapillata]|uniref:Uncharacterized protein n=1 Tax=Nemania bipapillata TaxID=110536 RepID=A0ACC2IFW8_9PEZI|nr:hypothetical protein ONZ43_g4988 [Nemania bipapillata]